MTAPVQLVNLALDAIGARAQVAAPVPTASDGSQAGDVACRQYQIRLDSLSRSAHWQCLRRQVMLTLLKAQQGTPENPSGALPQPPQPWLYEYALPRDYLKARYIPALLQNGNGLTPVATNLNNTPAPFMPNVAVPFEIAIDTDSEDNEIKVLLTNWPQAQLVYTAQIANPDLWDSQFTTAFIATLAAFFVNPLNRNAQLAGEQISIAKSLIESARISDGNEGPSSVDHTPDWIRARGWGAGAAGPGAGWLPWDSMVFPEGGPF